jgi:hypothetical protein
MNIVCFRRCVPLFGFALLAVWPLSAAEGPQGELLYNGIRLPARWPPGAPLNREPMSVPHLKSPPEVVPIDVGRQLFVDDFLIQETTLRRVCHRPEAFAGNPLLVPDQPWEKAGKAPSAMVFSDGVWWDPVGGKFCMWYMGGLFSATCYAESSDGLVWRKTPLEFESGTNVVVRAGRDSSTVWLDHHEQDARRRFKMLTISGFQYVLRDSPDGVHWSAPVAVSPKVGDRSTIFYNPFRDVWVLSMRNWATPRARKYREHRDLLQALQWSTGDVVSWVGADRLDPHNPTPEFQAIEPQLYNLDAVAYESVLLGLFSIWQGPDNETCGKLKIQKRNEVLTGFSRDGFYWDRPDRRPFLPVNPVKGAWNWGNVQSAGGCCLVVGDKLYFYHSGRALADDFWDGNANTGVAMLRRDGFASMDADAVAGTLTTRPLTFRGKHLFVNAAVQGQLQVEVLDRQGAVIAPFSLENCVPLTTDKTLVEVKFRGVEDLAALVGKPVCLRFVLRSGALYSFWTSPDAQGASHGYVAAGGPGFAGAVDDVGLAAYAAAERLAVPRPATAP